jgi:hypothetical protein
MLRIANRVVLRACLVPAAAAAAFMALQFAWAEGPSWWTDRGVLDPQKSPNDYAAVNMGQLKWIAFNAYLELETNLPGGAGTELYDALDDWLWDGVNYAPANVGHLKYLGSLFYRRLTAEEYTNALPWTNAPTDPDFALANIGQVKNLFDFDLAADSDADSMPDWWERRHFGGLDRSGAGDLDNDGLVDLAEYERRTRPGDCDSDDDGLPDGWEISHGLDPRQNDSGADSDGDGITNLQEFRSRALAVNVTIADPDPTTGEDSWDIRMNGQPVASCRNGVAGVGAAYVL